MSYAPPEPMVIYLNYPTATCCVCGEDCLSLWGLPVSSETGEIVANDFEGEWGGVPACQSCWSRHEHGEFVGSYPRY